MGKIDEVLAEMLQERERLAADLARVDRVIAALEEGVTLVGDGETGVANVPPGAAATTVARAAQTNLPRRIGPYTLLDVYEATAHYLSTVDTPKNSTEIAAALRVGGFKTRSRNFVNTVRVMLRRKDGRSTGISVTKDGKRWFLKRKAVKRRPPKTSAGSDGAS
ncbi:MAG TPA: hypothetical protein VNN25_11595 [Thermoanaerobaculia bacterium]|nr:hypothetical protein [Thermoanaerobaculia bacterium]